MYRVFQRNFNIFFKNQFNIVLLGLSGSNLVRGFSKQKNLKACPNSFNLSLTASFQLHGLISVELFVDYVHWKGCRRD